MYRLQHQQMPTLTCFSIQLLLSFTIVVSSVGLVLAQDSTKCSSTLVEKPERYETGTEKYYLAWILHGEKGQKMLAAQMLLDSDIKKELAITKSLYECEKSKMLQQALLLMLFDHKPADYQKEVNVLFDKFENYSLEIKSFGSWNPEPYAKYFAIGFKQLWFNTRNNAALRLVGNGYQDKKTFEHLLLIAQNPYQYSFRFQVSKRLELFDGIPPFDPGPEFELPGDSPFTLLSLSETKQDELGRYLKFQEKQLKAIKKWYSENASSIHWDAEKQRYRIGQGKK